MSSVNNKDISELDWTVESSTKAFQKLTGERQLCGMSLSSLLSRESSLLFSNWMVQNCERIRTNTHFSPSTKRLDLEFMLRSRVNGSEGKRFYCAECELTFPNSDGEA